MSRLSSLWLGVCFMLGLSACGNKGPLYLPDQAGAKKTVSETNKTPQKQLIEKKQ